MRSEFEQFVEKVAAENPDRVIDHTGWSSCAIGQFADEYSHDYKKVVSRLYEEYGSYEFAGEDWSIMDILNCYGEDEDGNMIIRTYGDLNNYLKANV